MPRALALTVLFQKKGQTLRTFRKGDRSMDAWGESFHAASKPGRCNATGLDCPTVRKCMLRAGHAAADGDAETGGDLRVVVRTCYGDDTGIIMFMLLLLL